MSSLIYDSFEDDVSNGNIDPAADTFYALIVTSSYTPDKANHTKRSDVTDETSGTGYTAGGKAVTCTVAKDTANHKETYTFSNPSWTTASFTGHAAVIYKHRGGASSADELVAYADFGADITATAGTFAVTFTSPITIQN